MKLIDSFNKKFGETSSHLFKTFSIYGIIALSMITLKILIARFYGQVELGIFTYFFSFVSLVFLFTSFGFPEAITQVIVNKPQSLRSVLKLYFPLISLTTVFFITLALIITDIFKIGPSTSGFNLSVTVYLVCYTLFYTIYSIFRGNKRFVAVSVYSLINRILFIVFIILMFFWSVKFISLLFGMSLTLLITSIITLPKLKRLVHNEKFRISMKKFVTLAFSLFLMQVGFYSLRFLSEIIIGYMVDFNTLGLYSANSSITNIVRLIAYVFPVVVLPMAVVSKYKLKESLKKILIVLIPFSVLVLIATYIFVPLFYGEEYKTIYLPIALIASSVFLVIYSYLNSVFVGENKFSKPYLKIIGFDILLSLIVNTLLNVWFISKWGVVGAPIATGITIILKIILNAYGIKKMRLGHKRDAEKINEVKPEV